MKKPLIVLTGPTAVGKTSLSISLAKAVNGEIISADSMQVYRKMDIGTAKIMPEEMDGIPHHLIDVLDPKEPFNVVLFKELATKAMDDIYARGRIPVIVGGTGFYIQAVLYDIHSMKMTMIKATVLIWNSLRKNMEISTFIRCLKKWIRRQPQSFIITIANV